MLGFDLSALSLAQTWAAFAATAAVVAVAGWKLAGTADRLADRTGWGEAMAGALLLGASTSLAGIMTSLAAAADGRAELSVSNAIGGIAVQTAFLGLADLSYPRANLEHAAASVPAMLQAALLLTLLAVPVLAQTTPAVEILGVHPATPFMLLVYGYGVRVISEAGATPMWVPHRTSETREDRPDSEAVRERLGPLWLEFLALAGVIAAAGWVLAQLGGQLVEKTALSESAVGGIFTAASTSLPELVTCLGAVRRGALTLAVSDIIGGNAFDVLFLAVADIAYRGGSIYHAAGAGSNALVGLALLMNGVLLMGLLRREQHGPANIGFESVFVLAAYVAGAVVMLAGGWA